VSGTARSGPVCPGIALLFAHCLAAPSLPPAHALGDGAKPPENRQNLRQDLPVDTPARVWQGGAAMDESEKQFSFTRAASSTSGRAKTKYKTAMGQGTVGMDQAVNAAIKEGFQPYGNPYKVFHRGI